jgi:hypothetical protein
MIYVFKTSVDSKSKLEFANTLLEELIPNALWNFDLDDCDNILRIESEDQINEMTLKNDIFNCIELE